jgi:hypothetical protein
MEFYVKDALGDPIEGMTTYEVIFCAGNMGADDEGGGCLKSTSADGTCGVTGHGDSYVYRAEQNTDAYGYTYFAPEDFSACWGEEGQTGDRPHISIYDPAMPSGHWHDFYIHDYLASDYPFFVSMSRANCVGIGEDHSYNSVDLASFVAFQQAFLSSPSERCFNYDGVVRGSVSDPACYIDLSDFVEFYKHFTHGDCYDDCICGGGSCP